LQILVGATMRHSGAGLAIPDFPLVFGGLIPPEWTPQTAIHYAHRVGALIVALAIGATAGHVLYHHPDRKELNQPALLLVCLVLVQVTLGAFIIWSKKDVAINTAHVITGALTLATSLVLTLRSRRVQFADLPATTATLPATFRHELTGSGARV
jgi:cytochrome c oxidase assembly protein subunit 15